MPIRVFYQNDLSQSCTIRPTPLVSIATEMLKTGAGETFGTTYTITLTGTLLADQGSPYGFNFSGNKFLFVNNAGAGLVFAGPYGAFDNNSSHFNLNRPPQQLVTTNNSSQSIFSKQSALRALFATDGQLMQISDFEDDGAAIICYPRVVSIDFQDGIYVDRCEYTIVLQADTLLRNDFTIDVEGTLVPKINPGIISNINEAYLLNTETAVFLEDFNEEWQIETDEQAENADLPRTYRITHTINATGKTHYGPKTNGAVQKISAYESAKTFVLDKLRNSPYGNYPNLSKSNTNSERIDNAPLDGFPFGNQPGIADVIGEGTLDLVLQYGGFNHIRSEQSNINAGTYSVTETWILAQTPVFENYQISTTASLDNPYVSVSIDGTIKGLSSISARGYGGYGDRNLPNTENNGKLTGYENALIKYNLLTNNGQFGLTSDIYKRANNVVAVQLNSQPKSITIGSNQSTSEITYNVQFDNRPTNVITGTIAESISVQDTYPGDLFAIIPVIGRKTGPVLQYIGGRTEYKRDLQINLTMDYTKTAYGPYRSSFMLQKPSIIEPTATELANLINQFSPANEPGIRKYFVSPPNESWNPKEGTYSLNLSWTYELNK